jgi:hypothetical protein
MLVVMAAADKGIVTSATVFYVDLIVSKYQHD